VKPLVFNSTPLIYLTKVGLSKVFEGLKTEMLTAPSVKREVVDEGKRKGVPDAIVLEKLFEDGVFEVVEPEDKRFLSRLLETKGVHVTDCEVLTLARERKGLAVIDDQVARKTAKVYGVAYAGTPYVLMRAVSERLITKERAKQAVNEMVFAGWRCSVESYAKIMEIFQKVQRFK
jgi:predicted nucleic acid-binding protein